MATAQATSPSTLQQVAPMSQRVLMEMYTPMTPAGSPAMADSAAKQAIAPPGTPGQPMESRVLLSITVIIMPSVTSTPQALAKNTIMKDIRIDTASMLMVAPSGSASEEISLGTSMSSAHRLLMGRVAEEEQVPKAFSAAGSTFLKNWPTGYLPMPLTTTRP